VKDAAQARRLLAIAAVLDGNSRTESAKIGGMDRQTLRDWVIRFNEQGWDGLVNRPPPGGPSKLTDAHRAFQVLERAIDRVIGNRDGAALPVVLEPPPPRVTRSHRS
jgi:putative transposase